MATTSYDRKYSIYDLQTWLKGYDLSSLEEADIHGASFSIQYNAGGRILVCVYPFTADGYQLIDGRQANFDWLSSMSRFNQKRFDTIFEKWNDVALYLCALYLIRGWQDPGWMNERLDDIAGLINGNSTYTPKMYCSDWFDRLRELDKANDQSKHEGAEAPTDDTDTGALLAIIGATDGSDGERRIVDIMRRALANGAQCVYNFSDDGVHDRPVILPLTDCFDPIPEGQAFDGWADAYDISLIEFGDHDQFANEYENEFSDRLWEFMADNENVLIPDDEQPEAWVIPTYYAIHVDLKDSGAWFEYMFLTSDARDAA